MAEAAQLTVAQIVWPLKVEATLHKPFTRAQLLAALAEVFAG
jgi:hypothetical protein